MDNKKIDFFNFFQSKKARQITIIVGISGILLIFLSTFFDVGKNKTELQEPKTVFSVQQYSQKLQNDLKIILQCIEGVGEADVLLTMENSAELVYLENSDTQTKQIEPVIRGVIVVCQGGDNPVVESRVIAAVTKGLSIPSSKVYVTKLRQQFLDSG